MGYVVRALKGKRPWKVQWASYTGGVQRVRDIGVDEYARLGFTKTMSLEEARSRRDVLNAQELLKRTEELRSRVGDRLKKEALVVSAWLPLHDVEEFEAKVLNQRDEAFTKRNKVASHWRCVQRLLLELSMEPSDWYDSKARWYDTFSRHSFSPAYVQKLLRLANQWGHFVSRKYGKAFLPVPSPRGYEKERIADSYFEENESGYTSDPLTPSMLEAASALLPGHKAWLHLSVWLGLRPAEVDNLLIATAYRIETGKVCPVLWVYQSKLRSVPREKRWKPIPLYAPQQQACVSIIKEAAFVRPLAATVRNHFGARVTTYGGRKGFLDLMLSQGHKFEDVSVWMGHTTIERSWRSYKNKQLSGRW